MTRGENYDYRRLRSSKFVLHALQLAHPVA
jgi:hypothetical protein